MTTQVSAILKHLNRLGFALNKDKFQIIDGVDQLGLLLAARAYNELNNQKPKIYPLYSEGVGQGTLPQYSDARFQDSVPQQIIASGGTVEPSPQSADFILAINSPADGIVQDATAKSNKYYASLPNKRYITLLNRLSSAGYKLSLADVSYSNGGDNGFMHYFAKSGGLEHLLAYNGWNTADNTIGYAIAQGIFAQATPALQRNKLIRQRLIDDWFYQSNARITLSKELAKSGRENLIYDLGSNQKDILQKTADITNSMAKRINFTKQTNFDIHFPWSRLFEVDVTIANTAKNK